MSGKFRLLRCEAWGGRLRVAAPDGGLCLGFKGIAVRRFVIAALAASLAGCGGSNFRPERATAVTPVAADALPAPALSETQIPTSEFPLGVTDKVAVRVFGAPDFNVDAAVDPAGAVTVPLIGDVPATGKTTRELAADIAERLGARYIRNPSVTVSLLEAGSRRVTLDGAVRMPGRYALTGPTSLTGAIALGQGTADNARGSEVIVFRTINGQRYAARFSLTDIRGGRAQDPAVFGNDVIVVADDRSRALLQDVAQVAPFLGLFYLFK